MISHIFLLAFLPLLVSAQKSYQQLATEWLVDNPGPVQNIADGVQRYALACVWYATNQKTNPYVTSPKAWKKTTNWMTKADECQWYGVTCTAQGIVTRVDLKDNGLTGTFPNEFSLISPSLLYLDISGNDVYAVGPSLFFLEEMTTLTHLDVSYTFFDFAGTPPYLSSLRALKHLDLSYTYMYGDVRGEVFRNMRQLTYLGLSGNYYVSEVPTQIANLPSIRRLYLDFSFFTGNLDWLGQLNPDIYELWADINNFAGTIPTTIGRLTGLVSLSLSGCQLTGTIPTQMALLTNMKQLWLFNNTLDGTIPGALSALNKMVTFQTEDNLLQGTMPNSICNLTPQRTSGGKLAKLSSDCAGSNPEVNCPCCQCCASPCFPDTPSLGFCFPGDSTVTVLDKGPVAMQDLQLGDYVAIGDNEYSRVYSFGHYNPNVKGDYISLQVQGGSSIEISKDHMIFVESKGAVPASSVSIGDRVIVSHGDSMPVTKVQPVTRDGAFAPFTESGTIIVNGFKASTYVSLQNESAHFAVGGVKLVSMQWLAHAFQAPHRLVCSIYSCNNESYTEAGISNWVYRPLLLSQWLVQQPVAILAILSVPVILAGGAVYLAELVFHNVLLVALVAAGCACVTAKKKKVE
jgi:hypothetical protein